MYYLRLSQENIAFSRFEAESVFGKKGTLDGHMLRINSDVLIDHLAYTKKIFIRDKNSRRTIMFKGKEVPVKKAWINEDKFIYRRPDRRPAFHPTSILPKLAKGMVNIGSAGKNIVCDPFCGTGGILIEACLLGKKAVGFDIESFMCYRAITNLRHHKLKNYSVKKADATTLKKRFPCFVCDPPYGKNTKNVDRDQLYHDFLKNALKLTKKMVIIFPSWSDYKKIIRKVAYRGKQWKIKGCFEFYIHRNLSRMVTVLEL